MKTLVKLMLFCSFKSAIAAADPQITSWFTLNSGKFARIYRTPVEKSAE